ncbi:MAG: right-handed parallel beta-helix repeat-containing protein, partial [Saprospiraceae bacterium]
GATLSSGSFTDRDFAFHLNKGIKIYGGFAGMETLLSQRSHSTNPTILSGDIGMVGNVSDNCYHVFITTGLSSMAVLDGCRIRDGNADGANFISYESNNFNQGEGGGLLMQVSNMKLYNNLIYNNRAIEGGGLLNYGSTASEMTNCLIFDNTATNRGGGIYATASTMTVTNCTFYENNSANGGGAVQNSNSSNLSLDNCLLWANASSGSEIINISPSTLTVNYSLMEMTHSGIGNIAGQNPLFVDESDPDGVDDILGTADDGLNLQSCSPAVDVGEDTASNPNVPLMDMLGNGRTSTTDMGSYEYNSSTPIPTIPVYVDITATGNNDGRSWTDAYTDLQDAIDHACEGREIWIAQGIYHPTRIPMGATLSSGSFTDRD